MELDRLWAIDDLRRKYADHEDRHLQQLQDMHAGVSSGAAKPYVCSGY